MALTIAEGHEGRNREAWAPLLLEMAGVPALGSDALTLSTTLDKAWASGRVEATGVPVASPRVVRSLEQAHSLKISEGFPLFVKPLWERVAKGIAPTSRVENRSALVREVERIARDDRQPALVETFLPGPEITVTVIGNDPPRTLPVLQRALEEETGIGLHALERHTPPAAGWCGEAPGRLAAALEAEFSPLTLGAYAALECRDFARVDFRLNAASRPRFLEMNPLPAFARQGSFGILAELEGRRLEDLLAEVLAGGLARLGLS